MAVDRDHGSVDCSGDRHVCPLRKAAQGEKITVYDFERQIEVLLCLFTMDTQRRMRLLCYSFAVVLLIFRTLS